MDEIENEGIGPSPGRLGDMFRRAEEVYLRVLRISVLVLATLLILYTTYLVLAGLYRISQSPSAVREAVANVSANEIVDAEAVSVAGQDNAKGPVADAAHQKFYDDFTQRYYQLFRTKFEPSRQAEDKTLTRDEFDDNFVQSAASLGSGPIKWVAECARG